MYSNRKVLRTLDLVTRIRMRKKYIGLHNCVCVQCVYCFDCSTEQAGRAWPEVTKRVASRSELKKGLFDLRAIPSGGFDFIGKSESCDI